MLIVPFTSQTDYLLGAPLIMGQENIWEMGAPYLHNYEKHPNHSTIFSFKFLSL